MYSHIVHLVLSTASPVLDERDNTTLLIIPRRIKTNHQYLKPEYQALNLSLKIQTSKPEFQASNLLA